MFGPFGQNPEKDREIIKDYRNTFSSPSGRKVLCHIVTELGLFDQVMETEADRVRGDYAKRLLMLCGIWQPQNIEAIMDFLFQIPIQEEKKDKSEEDNNAR